MDDRSRQNNIYIAPREVNTEYSPGVAFGPTSRFSLNTYERLDLYSDSIRPGYNSRKGPGYRHAPNGDRR